MRSICSIMLLVALVFGSSSVLGQEYEIPQPGPELDLFKADVGTWDVEIKSWDGPGEPTVSKGREVDRMLGGFWLLVEFKGNMMGMDFEGHGAYSYDAEKKQYVGSWIDSMGPTKMDMVGQYDKKTKTMTYHGEALGPEGTPTKHVLTTKYKDDGTHVMTMEVQVAGEMMKIFEMTYTRAAKEAEAKH